MTDVESSEGMHQKYEVYKDGESVDECFVLEPRDDAVARTALREYARVTIDRDLADDIDEWLDQLKKEALNDGE